MKPGQYKTRNGRLAEVTEHKKAGMTVFVTFGTLDGRPCHWTEDGRYRMDGEPHKFDLIWSAL